MSYIKNIIFKTILTSKSLYLLMFSFTILGYFARLTLLNNNSDNILYYGYRQIVSQYSLLILAIPVMLLINSKVVKKTDQHLILLKYAKISDWWKSKTKLLIISLTPIPVMIGVTVIVAIILGDSFSEIDIRFTGYVLYGFTAQFIGLLIIGVSYNILFLIFRKSSIAFIIPMVILSICERIELIFSIGNDSFKTLIEIMILNHIHADYVIGNFELLVLAILTIVAAILYYIGLIISESKDYLWKD